MSYHFEAAVADLGREQQYILLLKQIEAVVSGEADLIANLANVSALLKYSLGFYWVGFYLVQDGQLVLGPFQGPIACSRIDFGKGVCGSSAEQQRTIVVPDVDVFPGHIACSAASKSEIVVPLVSNKNTRLILDVDSEKSADFNEVDGQYLEEVVAILAKYHF